MSEQPTVTIPMKEYVYLIQCRDLLSALEEGGVDNWEGYWEATRKFYSDEEEEDIG